MLNRSLLALTAALALSIPMAHADDYAGGAIKATKTDKGEILANSKGMTLYTYGEDSKGKSTCYGQCADNWPPLTASQEAKPGGDFTLVKRKDGTMQWAYDGKPLYLWKNDNAPGDVTGDGVGGFHVATEEGY